MQLDGSQQGRILELWNAYNVVFNEAVGMGTAVTTNMPDLEAWQNAMANEMVAGFFGHYWRDTSLLAPEEEHRFPLKLITF